MVSTLVNVFRVLSGAFPRVCCAFGCIFDSPLASIGIVFPGGELGGSSEWNSRLQLMRTFHHFAVEGFSGFSVPVCSGSSVYTFRDN
jgi:hypothetical protein